MIVELGDLYVSSKVQGIKQNSVTTKEYLTSSEIMNNIFKSTLDQHRIKFWLLKVLLGLREKVFNFMTSIIFSIL